MIATAIVSPSARPRPSIAPLMIADLPNGQDGHPDHLPAGRAEGQGAFLEFARGLREDLAGDRGDDRQDHHREDQAGDEHRPAGGRGGACEEGDEAEVVFQPLHRPAPTAGPRTKMPQRP